MTWIQTCNLLLLPPIGGHVISGGGFFFFSFFFFYEQNNLKNKIYLLTYFNDVFNKCCKERADFFMCVDTNAVTVVCSQLWNTTLQ